MQAIGNLTEVPGECNPEVDAEVYNLPGEILVVERWPQGTDDSPKELSEAVQQTKLLLCLFELGLPLALSTFDVCVVSQLLLEDDERCVCDHEGPEEGDAAISSSSSFPAVA